MTLELTPEQEHRIQALLESGAYGSVQEVVDACLSAYMQNTELHFEGAPEELEGLLLEGLNSPELSEKEFWGSVDSRDRGSARREQGSRETVKVRYREAARNDLTAQFRHYLVEVESAQTHSGLSAP